MSLLQVNLGNGRQGTIELDTFTRMLKDEFYDNEEVRMDKPEAWANSYCYMAIAPTGSSIYAPVWSCIRKTFNADSKGIRMQYRENIAWADHTIGW